MHPGVVPDHPKNVEPAPPAAFIVTNSPTGKFAEQVPLVVVPVTVQLIPAGVLVTVPPPVCVVPACTVSGNVVVPGLNVVVTVSACVTVTWHVRPVPVQAVGEPLKPPNAPGVVAVSVTCVPDV
jgi:hypothetical protein